jgi:hypothetical protein
VENHGDLLCQDVAEAYSAYLSTLQNEETAESHA